MAEQPVIGRPIAGLGVGRGAVVGTVNSFWGSWRPVAARVVGTVNSFWGSWPPVVGTVDTFWRVWRPAAGQ